MFLGVKKEACVPVNRVVSLWCKFLLRKYLKSLVKAVVRTLEATESSWILAEEFLANQVH
jgi:hypothetical protein